MDSSSLLWEYENPNIPVNLKRKIEEIGHGSIVSMLSALSMFGRDLFSRSIRVIEFDDYKIFFEKIFLVKNVSVHVIAITDKNEKKTKLLRTLNAFFKIHSSAFLQNRNDLRDMSYERLSNTLHQSFTDIYNKLSITSFKRVSQIWKKILFPTASIISVAMLILSLYVLTQLSVSSLLLLIMLLYLGLLLMRLFLKRGKRKPGRYYRCLS